MPRKPASPEKSARSAIRAEEAELHFKWIDWLLAEIKDQKIETARAKRIDSDTALALAAGLQKNAVYRYRPHTPIPRLTINVLMRFYGVPGPETYLIGREGRAEDITPYDEADAPIDAVTRKMIALALREIPAAKAWVINTSALDQDGFLPGDVVLTSDIPPRAAGDAVIARAFNPEQGEYEQVFRRRQAPYLMSFSTDRSLLPIREDPKLAVILATVTHQFRSRSS